MKRILSAVLFAFVLILLATHQEVGIVGQAASAVPASPNFNFSPPPSVANWTCFVEIEEVDEIGYDTPEAWLTYQSRSFVSDVRVNSQWTEAEKAAAIKDLNKLAEVSLKIRCKSADDGAVKEWVKSPPCPKTRAENARVSIGRCHFILDRSAER